jgi:hypothetical protein
MPNIRSHDAPPPTPGTALQAAAGKRLLMALTILMLVHTTHSRAGEQASLWAGAQKPEFNTIRPVAPLSTFMAPIPAPFQLAGASAPRNDPPREFRPRGEAIRDGDARAQGTVEAPLMRSTTVWQQLSDYRSHDRVRVVTLWEAGGSSVSLQAGKKGDPSLQWTSRFMNRGSAARGVLDGFVNSAVGGLGRGLRAAPHTPAAEPPGRSAKLMDTGIGGPN